MNALLRYSISPSRLMGTARVGARRVRHTESQPVPRGCRERRCVCLFSPEWAQRGAGDGSQLLTTDGRFCAQAVREVAMEHPGLGEASVPTLCPWWQPPAKARWMLIRTARKNRRGKRRCRTTALHTRSKRLIDDLCVLGKRVPIHMLAVLHLFFSRHFPNTHDIMKT